MMTENNVDQAFQQFLQECREWKGTPHGYHFLMNYLTNPWRWFLNYYVGVEEVQSSSLQLGGAVHDAIHAFYRFGFEYGLKTIHTLLSDNEELKVIGESLYMEWANRSQPAYTVEHVELPLQFQLYNGFPISGRIDRIVRMKSNPAHLFILETKTTGWSIEGTMKKVAIEDQVTLYLMGTPVQVEGVLVEVLYYRKLAKGINTQSALSSLIYRSPAYIQQYNIMLSGVVDEIYQKICAFEAQPTIENALRLFPRNGQSMSQFGDVYMDLLYTRGFQLDYGDISEFPHIQKSKGKEVWNAFKTNYRRHVLGDEPVDGGTADPYATPVSHP